MPPYLKPSNQYTRTSLFNQLKKMNAPKQFHAYNSRETNFSSLIRKRKSNRTNTHNKNALSELNCAVICEHCRIVKCQWCWDYMQMINYIVIKCFYYEALVRSLANCRGCRFLWVRQCLDCSRSKQWWEKDRKTERESVRWKE